MGHAHHFLSRLDRVSLPHVELALGLYRDEELLRFILQRARAPEGAERVAISLDHPEEGPFLIVTRDGRFVTCLGAGMKTDDLPVITRGQLDAITGKMEALRERTAAAAALAGGGGANALLRRIYHAADELSREDFLAISALQPLYARQFLRLYLDAAIDIEDAELLLVPTLRKTERLKPVYKEALRSYWQTMWAMSTFAVLAAMDGAAPIPPALLTAEKEFTISLGTTRRGLLPIALRGAWAAARLGKPLLGTYKHSYQQARTFLENVDGALGLFALGLRHSRLRAEVDKALCAPMPEGAAETSGGGFKRALRHAVATVNDLEHRKPAGLALMHRAFGSKAWFAATRHLPPGHPHRFEREQDVPEALALTAAVNLSWIFLQGRANTGDALMWLLMLLPWTARAAPEDLFLPAGAQRAVHIPWTPERTVHVLKALRDHETHGTVPGRPAGPTRSGPCPCGSGKKYKRCCGAGESA